VVHELMNPNYALTGVAEGKTEESGEGCFKKGPQRTSKESKKNSAVGGEGG